MSIFGKLDAAAIPSNPFFVEKGVYTAEVTAASYKDSSDGQRQLRIEYTITAEDSQFLGSKVVQFFTLIDPEMTQETLDLLPAEEKKKIRKNISALKRTLCGNDANQRQKGLGVNPDDLNDENWDPAALIGTKIDMGISNYGPDNQGVNVQWVNLITE